MTEPFVETYKSINGTDIQLAAFPSKAPGTAPVLVHIHGGALMFGNRMELNGLLLNLLAERGYAQVSIDYRLAPETKLPDIIEDVEDAFRWVRGPGAERGGWDRRRIGVIGASAGGYLALMTGLRVLPLPKVLVSFYGYGDIVGPWYSQPDPFYCRMEAVTREKADAAVGRTPAPSTGDLSRGAFYLYCRQQGVWPDEVMGLDLDRHPEAFVPFCPQQNVTPDYPPTILLHGTADTDVPHRLSVDMAEALEAAGIEHELVSVPDGPHGFDYTVTREIYDAPQKPPSAQAIDRALAFLDRHLPVGGA